MDGTLFSYDICDAIVVTITISHNFHAELAVGVNPKIRLRHDAIDISDKIVVNPTGKSLYS